MRRSLVQRGTGQYPVAVGFTSGTTTGTTLTSSASAHTKGAWVELGTVPYDATALGLQAFDPFSTDAYLIDVAIGAPGLSAGAARCIVLPDLWWKQGVGNAGSQLDVPLAIPAGQALYARLQAATAIAKTAIVAAEVRCGGSLRGVPQRYVACGVTAGSTSATSIDAGGTANTAGAWANLAALGTAKRFSAAFLAVFNDTAGNRFALSAARRTGAGEQYLARQWCFKTTLAFRGTFWRAAQRIDLPDENIDTPVLAARCQCSTNASPARVLEVAAYLGEAA